MSYKKYNGIEYKKDGIDYSEQMGIAEGQGDFDLAAQYEKQHNAKVLGEGLDYELSYKYTKPEDYGFIPDSKKGSSAVPSTTSRSDAMNLLLSDLQKPSSFTYDPQSDPLYKNYKEQAERSAKNVSEDVMAQAAAMTGGMPSSYAVSAASQAASRQMQQADNMIPELYRLALDKYNAERSDKYKQLGVLMDLDNTEYNRGRDALYDERYAEETAYNRGIYADKVAYSRGRDALSDKRYDESLAREEAASKAQAEADAQANAEESSRWWAEFYAEQTGKDLDRASQTQKQFADLVFSMVEAGNVPKDEMMALAGIDMTGQEFFDNYRSNYSWQLSEKNKYSGTGSSGESSLKPKELKAVTPSMYTSFDKALTGENGSVEALERELAKYDWGEYDKQGLINYFKNIYGDNKEAMAVVYEYSDIPNPDKVTTAAKTIADKINGQYAIDSEEFVANPPIKAYNGGYSVGSSTATSVIDTVYKDATLTDKEVMEVLKLFGISEEQVKEYENNQNYEK